MATFTGDTDTTHVVTLPSEIESVQWTRRQAAPGGTVGLTIRTLFCGDGSALDVALVDAQGTTHASLSGELVGNAVTLDLSVPRKAVGGLVAQVSLPNHGLSDSSPALQVTDPVRVRGPLWSQSEVQQGEVVTLTAEARGAPDGRTASVRIFEHDPGPGAHDPVTQLRPQVRDGAVEVQWQFEYPGTTGEIVPAWEAPNGYTQPDFFYRVDVSGVRASSKDKKRNGLLTFVDDLSVQVLDAKRGTPYPRQDVDVTLADGSTQTVTTDGNGMACLEEVAPGPATLKLPDLGAPADEPVAENTTGRETATTPSSRGPLSAPVATGWMWHVWVAHAPFPLSG